MSPLCIEILLWHYGRAEQYPEWFNGEAQREIRAWLVIEGLIEADDSEPPNYKITERGRCLVEGLCNTPLPVQKWVMP